MHGHDAASEANDDRPWYRRYSLRWEVLGSYLFVAVAAAAGVLAVGNNSQHDIERNEDTIEQIVCGLRGFVDGLLEAGSNREVVLQQFDASLPRSVGCPTP